MKTFVVNMLKDIEKRNAIEQQLKKHPELDYRIWEAIEGKKLSIEEQREMILPAFKERYGRGGNLPAAGCSLSHCSIYRHIVDNNIPYALILEDDAVLANNLFIDEYVELLNVDTPVVVLLTSDFWYKKKTVVKELDSRHKIFNVMDGWMASGYLINKAGAALILNHNYPVQYVADSWKIFMGFGLKIYGVVPHLTTYSFKGEIGVESGAHEHKKNIKTMVLIPLYLKLKELKRNMQGIYESKLLWWKPDDM